MDCVHIRPKPRLSPALAELIVHDAEVARCGRRRLWLGRGANGLKNNVVRQLVGLGVVVCDGMFADFWPGICRVVNLRHLPWPFNGYIWLKFKRALVIAVHPTHRASELLPRHKTGGHYIPGIVGYPVVQSVLFRALASG